MAKNDSDREIAELLAELREQTEQNKPSTPEKASKKAKEMSDEDVKAMLRRYYTDVDTLPQEKEPAFELDTSDFVAEPEPPKPKKPRAPKKPPEPKPAPIVEEPVVEEPAVEEPVVEEPIVEEPIVEEPIVEEPVIEEPVVEEPVVEEPVVEEPIVEEPVVEEPVVEEPIVEEIIEETDEAAPDEAAEVTVEEASEPEALDEPVIDELVEEPVIDEPDDNEDEPLLDEIIYENPDIDDTESHFTLEEDVEPPEFLTDTDEDEPIEEDPVDIPVLPDEEDLREWRPTTDVSGRDDDAELDLMVALGLGDRLLDKYGEERIRRSEEKLRTREERDTLDINAHGYSGAELTPRSDPVKIEARYAAEQRRLTVRLVLTSLMAAVIFAFENMRLFGVTEGVFANTSLRALIPLLLLLGCAALSYKRVVEAVMFAIGRRSRGNVLLPISLIVMVVYDLTVILAFPQSTVALYNFPIALGIIFEVMSELFDIIRERRTFAFICDKGGARMSGLLLTGGEERDRNIFSAERIEFVEGYFRRSSDNRRSYPIQMFLTVLPLAAAGALLAIISTVVEIEPIRAVGTFPAIFAFAAPLSGVFGRSWQLLRSHMALAEKKTVVIGGSASNEYMRAEAVVFDDDLAFPSRGVTIKNVKLYDNSDIYRTIYNINALFEKAGGPLRTLMHNTASHLGEPKSVRMTGAGDHYVEALVDKQNTVCAGSFTALEGRGIDIIKDPNDSRDSENGCVMYAAINGIACARFCLTYSLDEGFKATSERLFAEGIGVRIRTLDPNLDRALLISVFGESAEVGIRREPHREGITDRPAATSVISRAGELSLADALITGRRAHRAERALIGASGLQLVFGVAAASLAVFLGVPSHMLSGCASIMQLLGLLSSAVIYSLNVKR